MSIVTTGFLQSTFAPIFDLIDAAGEAITIREHTGINTPYTNHAAIRAKPKPVRYEDLVEGSHLQQGDFFLIVNARTFPVARPLEQKDRITFRGRDYSVINDDPHQYSIGGVTYARVLHIRG